MKFESNQNRVHSIFFLKIKLEILVSHFTISCWVLRSLVLFDPVWRPDLTRIPNLWKTIYIYIYIHIEREREREKTHAKEKQSHAQNNIYMVWQFTYVHEVARVLLLSRKNTKCSYNVFLSLKKHDQQQTIVSKLHFLHPLHGLSLRKSPIKNHATLFGSSRVIKPDQTKLGSTKPNKK